MGNHLRLAVLDEVSQGDLAQHLIDEDLKSAPKRADGALPQFLARYLETRVFGTETGIKQSPSERRQDLAHDDLVGGACQRVAAYLSSNASHKAILAKNPHQLSDVRSGESRIFTDFVDGQIPGIA